MARRVGLKLEVVAAVALHEAEAVERDHAALVMRVAVSARDVDAVERQRFRIERAVENRRVDEARHMAFECAMTSHFVRQLVLDALHVDVAHVDVEVQALIEADRAVQHSIDHRRIDMEDLQAQDVVLEEIVAVHARKQDAAIAAAVEMDVADSLGMVERTREMNRVVHVARDGLIGRDERRDVLHARAHAVDAQVERPFARQADGARDEPRLLAAVLHEEIIDRDTIKAARSAQHEAVKRLLERLAMIGREIERDSGIAEAARELSLEIAETREVGARIEVLKQREVEMAAIEREIERLAAPDLALEAEVRVVRELCAQIVDLDVAAANGQRGAEAVDGERAITAFGKRDAAIRPEIIDSGTFAMRRDIGMHAARKRINPREGRRLSCRIRLHGCDVDIIGFDMRRIRLVVQRELALARDLSAEDARMDVLQVEHAVQEPCMR